MRPSSVGGGRILRCTLSVRLFVRPVITYLFYNIGHVFSSTLRTCVIFCFVYMSGPHIVRRSQPHKLVYFVVYMISIHCILKCILNYNFIFHIENMKEVRKYD